MRPVPIEPIQEVRSAMLANIFLVTVLIVSAVIDRRFWDAFALGWLVVCLALAERALWYWLKARTLEGER